MTTFNILGCCVLRDIFRIVPNEAYQVLQFIQFVSPVSFMEERQNQRRIEPGSLTTDWSPFFKRMLCHDFNKTVLDTLRSTPSDYMLVDLCELRFQMCRYTLADGDQFLITNTAHQIELAQRTDCAFTQSIRGMEKVEVTEEMLEDTLERYFDFLTSLYPQDRLIVVENYQQYRHLDDPNGKFHEYYVPGIVRQNQRLLACYEKLRRRLPDAHFIRMPAPCLGDVGHLWGADPLHFHDAYYHYLAEAVDLVLLQTRDEAARLEKLRQRYSGFFTLLEKERRMAYYLRAHRPESLLPPLWPAADGQSAAGAWKRSCSKGAGFDEEQHLLYTGPTAPCWAILSHPIERARWADATLTLSMRYQTQDGAKLQMVFRAVAPDGKARYLATRNCICDQSMNLDTLTVTIPGDLPEDIRVEAAVYLNHPDERAVVQEVRLETGDTAILLDLN